MTGYSSVSNEVQPDDTKDMGHRLQTKVIGQDKAVTKTVARAIQIRTVQDLTRGTVNR